MVVFAGQGDARRSMALLWQKHQADQQRPGPKPGLTVDSIVDAAISVADAEGMQALSMRAVGERLGRTAMALYTYVPSKGELVDLMYDRTLAELPTSYDLSVGWRAAVTVWARDTWEFYLRHPWLLQVSQARPVLGPNEYVTLETFMTILDSTGLEAKMVRRIVGALTQFVHGVAQTAAESRQAAKATGMTDEDWWYTRSALIQEHAPDFTERFPTVAKISTEGAFQMEDDTTPYLEQATKEAFETGLAVFLDGIEAAINRTSS